MAGGNINLNEICKFRHVRTGKYLSIKEADDVNELDLINSSYSLYTLGVLFILKYMGSRIK
jgi:hypothetical protein